MTRTALSGASISYCPSMSVVTPVIVPFIITPAPMTLSPVVAETTPFTVMFSCASAVELNAKSENTGSTSDNFLMKFMKSEFICLCGVELSIGFHLALPANLEIDFVYAIF